MAVVVVVLVGINYLPELIYSNSTCRLVSTLYLHFTLIHPRRQCTSRSLKMKAKDKQTASGLAPKADELTICDIMGEWGLYQWSLLMFSILYSAIVGITVVSGPIWTPDMAHVCLVNSTGLPVEVNFTSNPHECSTTTTTIISNEQNNEQQVSSSGQCSHFLYDDQHYGHMLTNSVSSRPSRPLSSHSASKMLF